MMNETMSQNPVKTSRLFYIDALRGLAILLVVIGHLGLYIEDLPRFNILSAPIYSFHMPLFMMISGFCINFKTFSLSKKRLGILIPFLFFGILYSYACGYDLVFFVTRVYKVGYWFLWVLTLFTLFLYIIKKIKVNIFFGLLIIQSILVLLFYLLHDIDIVRGISSIYLLVTMWPFFSLGMIIRDKVHVIFKRKILFFFFCSIIVVVVKLFIHFCCSHSDSFINELKIYLANFIFTTFLCVGLFTLFSLLEDSVKGKKMHLKCVIKRMANDLGTFSLQIYVIHYFVLRFVLSHRLSLLGDFLQNNIYMEIIIYPILAMIVCYICIYVTKLLYRIHLGFVFGR